MKKHTAADLDPALREAMEAAGIDTALTLDIVERYNRGEYDIHARPHEFHIPPFSGDRFFDRHGTAPALTVERRRAEAAFRELELDLSPAAYGLASGDRLAFGERELEALGLALLPFAAYGVLNGGSASSYADPKKNRAASEELFGFYRDDFEKLAAAYAGRPKGLTAAFQNPDGTPGPSFMELKLRSLLIESRRLARTASAPSGPLPFFQMTSVGNDREIAAALCDYAASPFLRDLAGSVGFDCAQVRTAVQPLLAAYTGSDLGRYKWIFANAFGEPNRPLAMPGGHGQNFYVLREIYRDLYRQGRRFAWLGNIDNLGYTVDPVSLAVAALRGADAAFEFSFRTPIDVKGGILVENRHHRLDCGDLGPAISFEEMLVAERSGKKILFNCAIGLFSLAHLVKHLDRIIASLPVRFSEQDKKAGRYSQAEQITWEVIGLLDKPLILGVGKYDRFLAVKVLVEGLMTSGLGLEKPGFPAAYHSLARDLHSGLTRKLGTVYGLREENGRWIPKTLAELDREAPGRP